MKETAELCHFHFLNFESRTTWCQISLQQSNPSGPLRIWTSLQQMVLKRHTGTLARTHSCSSPSHCGSRLVQLLLGSDINTEQIGGDLQPLLFDLSSSCHISWHCPPATPRGAGRTGMASTCLPGLFSVFFLVQLIPLCPLHGCSSADYKSSPTPSDSPHSRERLGSIPASAQKASLSPALN